MKALVSPWSRLSYSLHQLWHVLVVQMAPARVRCAALLKDAARRSVCSPVPMSSRKSDAQTLRSMAGHEVEEAAAEAWKVSARRRAAAQYNYYYNYY